MDLTYSFERHAVRARDHAEQIDSEADRKELRRGLGNVALAHRHTPDHPHEAGKQQQDVERIDATEAWTSLQ